MNNYDIGDLERISGIKAHTIRIWEKRYKLFHPKRTDTNIRLYSDDDVRKLLNIKTLLDYGWKISKIASLSDQLIVEQVFKYSEEKKDNHKSINHIVYDYFINELLYYGLIYDEVNFELIYLNAISKYGFIDSMIKIVYPLLRKIGLLWETSKAIPSQEHFISNLIRKKIISATDALPIPTKSYKSPFILFLPENEYHEIPLLFSNYVLRSKQIKTIYLGSNVPLENVIEVGKKNNVEKYLTILISNHSQKELLEIKNSFTKIFNSLKNYRLYLGGNLEVMNVFKGMNNAIWMNDVNFLLKI